MPRDMRGFWRSILRLGRLITITLSLVSTSSSYGQTSGISQETRAIHLRQDEPAPWEGALIRQSLLLYYRNQTDENDYLRTQLKDIQAPIQEITPMEEMIFTVLAFSIGLGFGIVLVRNGK